MRQTDLDYGTGSGFLGSRCFLLWETTPLGSEPSSTASSSAGSRASLFLMKRSKSKSFVGVLVASLPLLPASLLVRPGVSEPTAAEVSEDSLAAELLAVLLTSSCLVGPEGWSRFSSFFTLSRAGSMMSRKPMTQEASSTTSVRCQHRKQSVALSRISHKDKLNTNNYSSWSKRQKDTWQEQIKM